MTQQRRTPGQRGTSNPRPTLNQRSTSNQRGSAGQRVPVQQARRAAPGTARRPRSASRPAGVRRTAGGTGGAKRTTAPQPNRLTGRATVLVLVLGALLLAYAYPVRVYLDQQTQIASMEASQAAAQQRIRDLTAEASKWNDDEYVKAQAKRRLQMVLPGETAYMIVDPSAAAQNPGADPNTGKATNTGPWYGKLWSSVRAADRPRPTS